MRKSIWLSTFIFTFVILLVFCLFRNRMQPGTRVELPDSERWVQMLRMGDEWHYGGAVLSPDGKWIASDRSQEFKEDFLDIIPTWDENLLFTFRPEQALGMIAPSDPIWSPDSANLAYWGVDTLKPYCYPSRLVILQINATNLTAIPAAFELPKGESGLNCATFVWSPDGSMLAVNPDSYDGTVYIINTNGTVLNTISIPGVQEQADFSTLFDSFQWTRSSLFYTIYQQTGRNSGYRTLYQLDLINQKGTELFHLGNWRLLDADPTGSSRLLITQSLSQLNDPTLSYKYVEEYAILNTETQEIRKLKWEKPVCQIINSISVYTAFACSNPLDDNPLELWIYNWEEESLNNYGEYDKVLGWSERYQGFLLLENNGDTAKVVVLQP